MTSRQAFLTTGNFPEKGYMCTPQGDDPPVQYLCAPFEPDRDTVIRKRRPASKREYVGLDEDDETDEWTMGHERKRSGQLTEKEKNARKSIAGIKKPSRPDDGIKIKESHSCIVDSAKPLKDHQTDIVHRLTQQKGVVAVHGVGTGKTLSAVTSTACVLDNVPEAKRVLVITPAALVTNFKEELIHYAFSRFPEKSEEFISKYTILSYDTFRNQFKDLVDKPDKSEFLKSLKNVMKGCVLVVDEAHRLASEVKIQKKGSFSSGKTAFVIIMAAKFAVRSLALTATLLRNKPFDAVNPTSIARGDGVILTEDMFEELEDFNKLGSFFSPNNLAFYKSPRNSDYAKIKEINEVIFMTKSQQYEYERIESSVDGATLKFTDPKAFYTGLRQAINAIDSLKINKLLDIIYSTPSVTAFPNSKIKRHISWLNYA